MSKKDLKVTLIGEDKTGKAFGSAGSSASGFGDKMKKVGKVAATAFLAVGAGAAVAGTKLFGHGAALEAMANKADTVFGSQIGKVSEWAKANAAGMGLSSREAVGLAANFGDLLIPMGFTRDQAAAMSTEVVGLSGALSQWSGGTISASQASDVLAKAMLGERDGLKALGISISDADVKARLLKNGTDQLTGAALEQAKATATQQLIMEKSTDAQAAYKEGGNKLLVAQNNLKAKFKELYDETAIRLIPVFTQVATFVTSALIPTLEKLWKTHGPAVKEAFAAVGTAMSDLAAKIKAAADLIIRNWDAIKKTAQVASVILGPIFAVLAVHWGAVATAATVSAAKQAAAWVMTQVGAAKSAIVHGATVVKMVAGWVLLGAQALANGAKIAAGWLLALGPIGVGIAAFVAIAAAIVVAWQKSETFRNIVKGAMSGALAAVSAFIGGIEAMLRALGRIPGFGWADTAANKVANARSAVDGLRNSMSQLKSKTVTVTYQQVGSITSVPYKQRAKGGPVSPGRPYLVGEEGPELIVPKRSGHVMTAKETAGMGAGGRGSLTVNINASGENVDSDRLMTLLQRAERLAGV